MSLQKKDSGITIVEVGIMGLAAAALLKIIYNRYSK